MSGAAAPPRLVIVAGPNGSGKTTTVEKLKQGSGSLRDMLNNGIALNADDRVAAILAAAPGLDRNAANLRAAQETDDALAAAIEAGCSVLVETVLSSDKYKPMVERAETLGYEVILVFICLENVDLNVWRVAVRAKNGGHNVPEERIRNRYDRSLANLPWFFSRARQAWVIDNSAEGAPELLATEDGRRVDVYTTDRSHPALAALETAGLL